MSQPPRSFLARHKRKFIVGGALSLIAGGGLAYYGWRNLNDRLQAAASEDAKRSAEAMLGRELCHGFNSLYAVLNSQCSPKVQMEVDIMPVIQRIRELEDAVQRREHFRALRALTLVEGTSSIFLSSINLMFVATVVAAYSRLTNERESPSPNEAPEVLALLQAYFTDGQVKIVDVIRYTVAKYLESPTAITLDAECTVSDVRQTMQRILLMLLDNQAAIIAAVLPKENPAAIAEVESEFMQILRDLLELSDWSAGLKFHSTEYLSEWMQFVAFPSEPNKFSRLLKPMSAASTRRFNTAAPILSMHAFGEEPFQPTNYLVLYMLNIARVS